MGTDDKELNDVVGEFRIKLQQKHIYYYDLLTDFPDMSFRQIMIAWGRLRESYELSQDGQGRYYIDAHKSGSG